MSRPALPLAAAVACLLLAAGTAAAPARAQAPCPAGLEPWTEVSLYLGRSLKNGAEVSEEAFRDFLRETVTPRFPDGLSVLDVSGQWRNGAGAVVREASKLIVVLVPDSAKAAPGIAEVIAAYKERFGQESVLRVEQPACVAF